MNAKATGTTVSNAGDMVNSAIKAIDDCMNAVKGEDNQQGSLIVWMFNQEVSFGISVLERILRSQKKERTAEIDNALSDLSQHYKKTLASVKAFKERFKAEYADRPVIDQDKAIALNEQNTRAVRSARLMLTRVISSVYGLRTWQQADEHGPMKLDSVAKAANSALLLTFESVQTDAKGRVRTRELITSCRKLTAKGEKAWKEKSGVVPSARTKKSAPEAVLTDALRAAETSLAMLDKASSDLPDDAVVAFEGALKSMIVSRFADTETKTISMKDVLAFLHANFITDDGKGRKPEPKPTDETVKASNGVTLARSAKKGEAA